MAVENSVADTLASKLANSYVGVRNDLEVSRHVFFGETSYVVRDPISFEGHSFSPIDYEILISLTDEMSLGEIFDSLTSKDLVSEEQAEDYYRFVIELQSRALLSLPVTDGEALYRQYEQKRKRRAGNPLMKLLFLKIPLGCPDRILKTSYHWVRPLFTRAFFTVWLLGLLAAVWIVVSRWSEFTSELSSVLAIQNLPAILIVMSGLKLWHELGHGFACRHYGVSVPHAGLLFMIGTPLAYVDATGSWSLPQRRQRQVINLAGIYFEMMIAIIAAFVWAFSENASIQSLAHFTLLISSVTTIGFNFNPLMKYDGYYVLADLLGIPNLKSRAAQASTAVTKKIFFGISRPTSESVWLRAILVMYGVSATIYKWMLVVAISMLLAMQIWVVGLLVGGYYFFNSVGTSVWQAGKYLLWSDELKTRRPLALCYFGLLAIGIPALLWCCPVPGRSAARGVVENESVNVVNVSKGGFLTSSFVIPGEQVKAGDALGRIENIGSVAQSNRKQVELARLEMKYRSEQLADRIKANQTYQQIRKLQFEINLDHQTPDVELIQAPVGGQIIACTFGRGTGNYLEPGAELLRIGTEGWRIRAVANARSLADVKPQIGQSVHCRFYADPTRVYPATIRSVSSSGSRVVQHESLTQLAGGFIPVDPETMEATEPFFELVLELSGVTTPEFLHHGAVCEIRFKREYEPFGQLIYRSLLRFTNKLSVQ